MRRREQINLLRRVATLVNDLEDAKQIRILAQELQKELDQHNEIANRSYHNKKKDTS